MMFKLPIYHILVIYEYAFNGIWGNNNDLLQFSFIPTFVKGIC